MQRLLVGYVTDDFKTGKRQLMAAGKERAASFISDLEKGREKAQFEPLHSDHDIKSGEEENDTVLEGKLKFLSGLPVVMSLIGSLRPLLAFTTTSGHNFNFPPDR